MSTETHACQHADSRAHVSNKTKFVERAAESYLTISQIAASLFLLQYRFCMYVVFFLVGEDFINDFRMYLQRAVACYSFSLEKHNV